MKIARARAHFGIEARNRFKIVVKHVRARFNDDLQDRRIAFDKIRRQDFDGCVRALTPDRANGLREMLRPAIKHIIAVHGGDDHMVEPQFLDRIRDPTRLEHVQIFRRLACRDIAEGTSPRADLTHDHHRGVALVPAFADIRAARLFADGDQLMLTHNVARGLIAFTHRRFDPDPIGLLGLRRIRAALLFRMALSRYFQIACRHVQAPLNRSNHPTSKISLSLNDLLSQP